MTLSIQSLAKSMGAEVYWEEDWHIVLESHLLYLMNPSIATPLNVDPHDAYKYTGDLWGYLMDQQYDPQYYWPIMRASGLYSPSEFNSQTTQLLIPSTQFIDTLRKLYQTIASKIN